MTKFEKLHMVILQNYHFYSIFIYRSEKSETSGVWRNLYLETKNIKSVLINFIYYEFYFAQFLNAIYN